jgi:Pectate lyase superfamily protein
MRKLLLPLALLAPLFLPLSATPANAACIGGTVTACGADPTGKKDSTAAFAAAIAATPAGGTLTIPAGTYAVAIATIISKPITINCLGTIKPFSNPPGPTPFFLVTAAPFTFDGHNGACVFDGVSAATNNFIAAVNVAGSTDLIGPAKVTGLHIKNMALNETQAPYSGISMTAVRNCTISNNVIENSGPNKSFNGGFGIYLAYTANCAVSGNSGDHLGGTFINDSASVGTVISNNKVSYVVLA